MDFKSLMSAQISKAKNPVSTTGSAPKSKYQRRAEVEAEREAAYAADQARLEVEQEERAAKKRKLDDDEADKAATREAKLKKLAEESKSRRETEEKEEERRRRKRLGLPELPEPGKDGETDADTLLALEAGEQDMPDDELRSKLRALSQPISLFDESHSARLARYYTLTRKSLTKRSILSKGPIPTTLSPVEEKDMLLPTTLPKTPSQPEILLLYRQIASYLTLLLTEWSIALSLRPTTVKESSTGRAAHQSYTSVLRELTPLYRKLEDSTLDPDLLAPLCEIVSYIQKRQYVKANDTYLRLSIGKAAWPIGVTMVGIHERSARQKLHETDKQGHIMSDEVTRKMLQSLKRCISFAQTRWPPDDLAQLMG